jgi:aspartate/methionine/tyrosine aminotransferase
VQPFTLERFFAEYEFAVSHVACASDVEPLSLNELLALADDEMLDAWDQLSLGYTRTEGHAVLRQAIAAGYSDVTPEQVLVCAGAEEAIFLLMHTLLEPGEHAIVTWPAYQSLNEIATARGVHVDLLPLEASDGWRLDLDRLQRLMRPATRLIVVNFPHNPTGALPSREEFEALNAMARYSGCRVLSDEVYRGLEPSDDMRLPAACELDETAVSIGVMSKVYGLAGLRIGWIATRDERVINRAAELKDYTTICAAAPSELLATIALRARKRLIDRARTIVSGNRVLLDEFFARWELESEGTFTWLRPRAGSTAFPSLDERFAVEGFTRALASEEGVLLAPGHLFGHPGNHFRVGLGRARLAEALQLLGGFTLRRVHAAGGSQIASASARSNFSK